MKYNKKSNNELQSWDLYPYFSRIYYSEHTDSSPQQCSLARIEGKIDSIIEKMERNTNMRNEFDLQEFLGMQNQETL